MNDMTIPTADGQTSISDNNADSIEKVLADARKFGGEAGTGEGARANLFVRLIEAAQKGVVDTEKRQVKGYTKPVDHAEMAYDEYVTASGKKSAHGDKTKVAKASALRSGVVQGMRNDIDFVEVMNRAQVLHKQLKAQDEKACKSAFEAYLAVASAQKPETTELDDDQIRSAMAKSAAREKDVEAFLKAAANNLEKAFDLAKDEKIEDVYQRVNDLLTTFVSARELSEKQAQLAALQAELGIAA